MRPLTVLLLSGAGAASLCASGCFGTMYNPNAPWGGTPGYYQQYNAPMPMNGYPGSYQMMTPSQQYIPGMQTVPGNVLPPGGGGGNVLPTPTYGPGSNTSPVPNPSDPNSPFYGSPGAMNETYLPPKTSTLTPTEDAPPFTRQSSGGVDGNLSTAAIAPANGPSLRQAGMSRSGGGQSELVAQDGKYAHDAASYKWLEGVVSYDATDRSWNIMYSVNPAAEDEYAGHFTLGDSPLCQTFRDGEQVRLEGAVDTGSRDRFGKATYMPERIIRSGG